MTRIFISYSRRDKAVADYIGAELRNRGADVFIDYQKLTGGENFIGRLGREIEASDHLVLLMSPRSVESPWVQAEVAWAFTKKKTIVPVILEPATMVDFFVLANLEQVDFTRWSVDGKVDGAVRKLAASLGLPTEPTCAEPVPAAMVEAAPSEGEAEAEAATTPGFARGDLTELFLTAAEVADEDPEQAVFLYQRILEIDPDYMQGQARAFVDREETRLEPIRLARMQAQAEAAMQAGEWKRAEQIGRDMLKLEKEHADAQRIVDTCAENAKYEPLYQQAVVAAGIGRWRAVDTLLRDVRAQCPTYGDPAGLFTELVSSMHELAVLEGHTSTVYSVAFSPDGKLLASGSNDDTIRLWDTANKQGLAALKGHAGSVYSVAFSPDGKLLASGSHNNTIRLRNTASKQELTVLEGHANLVFSVAFSPDGKLLASGSVDNTVKLWDTASKQALAVLEGHANTVRSVAFSPDGKLLASGSDDNTIELWDTTSKQALAVLEGHAGSVSSVAFSPDGKLLASGSDDKTIRLWGLG